MAGHVRVDFASFLGARLVVGVEENSVSYKDRALGFPSGSAYDGGRLARVRLAFSLEPTLRVTDRLGLFAGFGIGWGRTIVSALTVTGPTSATLPAHAAVFVEYPVSVGVRFEVLPNWLVLTASGVLGILSDQSGSMLSTYSTPDSAGHLTTAGAYPSFATSWQILAGLGVLL